MNKNFLDLNNSLFSNSKHFNLQQLAPGIFAAVATEGGAAICNTGFVDLGGQLVVFDSFLTPQAAQDLKRFIITEFSKPPDILINSHYHNDHTWGNQVFAEHALIISSTQTRQLFETEGFDEYKWYSANATKRLEALEQQIQAAEDSGAKDSLTGMLGYYQGLVEAMPTLKLCSPKITFECQLELSGTKRTCVLKAFENAHTGSDVIMYLPKDGIVFTGDLLFTHAHPYLIEGNPHQLLNALHRISEMDAHTFVPGHGPIGTRDDIKAMTAYIEFILETAASLDVTKAAELVRQMDIPPEYRGWNMSQYFYTNLAFFVEQSSKH